MSAHKQSSHSQFGFHATVDSYTCIVVDNLIYLQIGINVNNNNSNNWIVKSITKLYKSFIIYVLLYGAEAWMIYTTKESALGDFERKNLRTVYRSLRIGHDKYRRRWNDDLYGDLVIAQWMKKQRLRWLGHVFRMNEGTPALKVLNVVISNRWCKHSIGSISWGLNSNKLNVPKNYFLRLIFNI